MKSSFTPQTGSFNLVLICNWLAVSASVRLDSNEDYAAEELYEYSREDSSECGKYSEFEHCVAQQTLEALDNVMYINSIGDSDLLHKKEKDPEQQELKIDLEKCRVKPWLMIIK